MGSKKREAKMWSTFLQDRPETRRDELTRSRSVCKPERLFSLVTLIEFWDIHVYENWIGDAEAAAPDFF